MVKIIRFGKSIPFPFLCIFVRAVCCRARAGGDVWGRRGRIAGAGRAAFVRALKPFVVLGRAQRSRRPRSAPFRCSPAFCSFHLLGVLWFCCGFPPIPSSFRWVFGTGTIWVNPSAKPKPLGGTGPVRSAKLDPAEEGEAGGRDRRETPPSPCTPGCGAQRGPRAGGSVGAPARRLGRGQGVRWMDGWDSACKQSDVE